MPLIDKEKFSKQAHPQLSYYARRKLEKRLLAQAITDQQQEAEEQQKEIVDPVAPEVETILTPVKDSLPQVSNKRIEVKPQPVKIIKGISATDPIVINRSEREIFNALEELYGFRDGDYFIINDNIFNNYRTRKRYKVLLIEDKNKFSYRIWFDITNLSLVRAYNF